MGKLVKWGCLGLVGFVVLMLVLGMVIKVVDPEGWERIQAENKAKREQREAARLKQAADEGREESRRESLRNAHLQMTATPHWSDNGIGVMTARFSVRNNNSFAVRDFTVQCELTAASGTVIDTARETVYEVVPARTTRRTAEINLGFIRNQARRAACEVTSAKPA